MRIPADLIKYTVKKNSLGFFFILLNYLCIVLGAFSILWLQVHFSGIAFWFMYLIVAILLSSCWRRFEILVHEAAHRNVFNTSAYNHKLEFLFAYPVFLDVKKYLDLHGKHHRLIGNFEEDPDLLIYEKWGLHDLPKNWFKILVLRPLSLYFTWEFFSVTFKNFWLNKKNIQLKIGYWITIAGIVTYFSGWELFVWVYSIPFLLVLPFLRFYARANEHTGVDFSKKELNARNNLGFFNRYILHPYGDAYHQIHHLWPFVPFYNLSKVHQYLIKNKHTFIDSYSVQQSLIFTNKGSKVPKTL